MEPTMPHVTWVSAHGALTHFPIAMLIAMFCFDIGAAVLRKPEWKIVSFWLLVTAVVGCIPSLVTGLQTGNTLFQDSPLPHVALLHRNLAYGTSIVAFLLLALRVQAGDKLVAWEKALAVLLSLVAVALVSWTGYLGGAMTLGEVPSSSRTASAPPPPLSTAQTSGAASVGLDSSLIAQGRGLYAANNCAGCHQLNGSGGSSGPDLTHEGTGQPDIAWQIAHLQDPQKMNPSSFMPKYARLGDANLKALAEYLVSNK
jgi:mono/diheme cytochrome c family protein